MDYEVGQHTNANELRTQAEHYERIARSVLFCPSTKKSLLQHAIEFRKRAMLEEGVSE